VSDLTDDEKRLVAGFLRQNAEWSKATLQDLGTGRYVAGIRKQLREEIAAFEFVANWIEALTPKVMHPIYDLPPAFIHEMNRAYESQGVPMSTETIEPLATSGDTSAQHDAAAANFKSKFAANVGAGITIPWDQIIAALLSLLGGGCGIPLTPANVKAQVQRPLFQARLFLQFLRTGVPANIRSRAITATVKTIHEATDSEVAAWVAAAQEGE